MKGIYKSFSFFALILCISYVSVAQASRYIRDEGVVAPTVTQETDDFSYGFKKTEKARLKFKKWFENLPQFLSESSLTPNFRAYSFRRKFSDKEDPDAIALGGELKFLSGRVKDTFQLGASYYVSHGIDDNGKDGTLLLGSDQSDINALGQLYLDTKLNDSTLRLYRQAFGLPYLNEDDSRMVPNTHEAYALFRRSDVLGYIVGHVTKMKERDSESFTSMSEVAGADDRERGTTMAGARYHFGDDENIGAITYYTWDTFNIFYSELNLTKEWNEKFASKFSTQFTHQESVGDELIGEFDTNHYGVQVRTSYQYATLTLAATNTGSDSGIRSPYGGRPSYLSLMRQDFDRANEVGVLVGLSYDFEKLNLPGLSAFTNVAWGNNAEDSETRGSLPNATEYDFTIDYKPKGGAFHGVWLRMRYAYVDFEGGEDTSDTRIILNYELPFKANN